MSHIRTCPRCGNQTFVRLLFIRAPWKCKNPDCRYEESQEALVALDKAERLDGKEW